MLAESKRGISQDKVFHEICKQGLLSVYISSSLGFFAQSCLPEILKKRVKTLEKSISPCLCKSNKAKLNSRMSPQSHSVIREGQSLISGSDSLEKSFILYLLLTHLNNCWRVQFVLQKTHTPLGVFYNPLHTHKPPPTAQQGWERAGEACQRTVNVWGGTHEATHALRNVSARSHARSLLHLQIKPAKTDRSVGINMRKCLHFTIRLSKAYFFSASSLLFMPERCKRKRNKKSS